MNIQHFRKSVKTRWLTYYAENRPWITHLRVWVNCDGQRRPSSSFILAALSVLEPNLNQMLPLIVDLSSNPDRIVAALGLNFNPDEHPTIVKRLQEDRDRESSPPPNSSNGTVKMLPPQEHPEIQLPSPIQQATQLDEACPGSH